MRGWTLALPAVERACEDAAHCEACAFFCKSVCRRAYFQSVECYENLVDNGYNGKKVSRKAATGACDHFLLRCWQQYPKEMGEVLKSHTAETSEA